jgi:hypothetical protein
VNGLWKNIGMRCDSLGLTYAIWEPCVRNLVKQKTEDRFGWIRGRIHSRAIQKSAIDNADTRCECINAP